MRSTRWHHSQRQGIADVFGPRPLATRRVLSWKSFTRFNDIVTTNQSDSSARELECRDPSDPSSRDFTAASKSSRAAAAIRCIVFVQSVGLNNWSPAACEMITSWWRCHPRLPLSPPQVVMSVFNTSKLAGPKSPRLAPAVRWQQTGRFLHPPAARAINIPSAATPRVSDALLPWKQ